MMITLKRPRSKLVSEICLLLRSCDTIPPLLSRFADSIFDATAVRVRPPLDPSDPGFDLIPHRFRGSTCQVNNPTTLTVESSQGRKLFVFDRIFSDKEDQSSVWEYVSESVNSFVQGYNVSILAYGQSGAGKSYTMGTTSPGEQAEAKLQGELQRRRSHARVGERDVAVGVADSRSQE